MYYYAFIDPESGVCLGIEEHEEPFDNQYYIQLDFYDESLLYRKKYVNGEWVDTTPDEAQREQARHIGINGEWLDDKIVSMDEAIASHIHPQYVTGDDFVPIVDIVLAMGYDMDAKASIDHTHPEYAAQSDLDVLEDVVDTKADSSHTHDNYANVSHEHSNYATTTEVDTLAETVGGKANATHTHSNYAAVSHTHAEYADTVHTHDYAATSHTHSNYADVAHNHDNEYSTLTHTHTASEIGAATSGHNHDASYANIVHYHDNYSVNDHDHDLDYAPLSHAHVDYATKVSLDELAATVSTKANASHSHDDRYYTETEIDTKLSTKADSTHNHAGLYDVNGAASEALDIAKGYTDSKIDALVGDGASTTLDTIGEISSAIEDNQEAIDLLNSAIAGKANASHTHSISNITNLQTTLDGKASSTHTHTAVEVGAAANSHSHNDVYYTEVEVDALLSGKANSSHTHSIANVSDLQSALDGKAASSHGTHVSYSTTTPVMDGTASVGSASTVARSDHKHPTDTSRAAQTSLDSHTSNKSNPHGVSLSQLGITATAAELNALDGITATVTELNYVDGVTSNIQTQLNGKAASGHTHNYAGSSSTGGAATSANKLNTNDGSAIQPVYFANGVPVKTTYTLGASVPSGAKFTDTTYEVATASVNGLMSANDKSKLDGMVMATVAEVETYLGI